MSEYITKVRTVSGDLQIDYNALANLPISLSAGVGTMQYPLALNSVVLTEGVSYGDTLPKNGTSGRLFFLKAQKA